MYSEAELAAFKVLLDRALANEVIDQDHIEGILPPELFDRFLAYSIKHENDIIDRYDEEAYKRFPVPPGDIQFYRNQLSLSKRAFKAAPKRIEKLMSRIRALHVQLKRAEDELNNSKPTCWHRYQNLSEDEKLWIDPSTAEAGWPPNMSEEPPMKLVLPDDELPEAYALRRVLSEIVGDNT